jgi:hypothetical protein
MDEAVVHYYLRKKYTHLAILYSEQVLSRIQDSQLVFWRAFASIFHGI